MYGPPNRSNALEDGNEIGSSTQRHVVNLNNLLT